jgi:hypothetical protein
MKRKWEIAEIRDQNGLAVWLLLSFSMVPSVRADDWDRIRKEAGEIQTINAQFVQEKHLEILIKPLISKGVLFLFHGGRDPSGGNIFPP